MQSVDKFVGKLESLKANKAELEALHKELLSEYEVACSKNLKLDMSRGKPSEEQLELSREMLDLPLWDKSFLPEGDPKNYGILTGLSECRELFAQLLDVSPKQVFAGGNSSLNLMYDTITKAYIHGLLHSPRPWSKEEKIKFLCPAPGYDRHFTVSESFGMEMITVRMTETGPDMDQVEELVKDPAVKGMWSVPKYSNPDGIIYSEATMDRIANLKPAAKDFVVMWDNSYMVHQFDGDFVEFPDLIAKAKAAGNEDMVMVFASTSKITFPGSGVACFATSENNIKYLTGLIGAQAICYDKVNQLRHVLFLKDKETVLELMKKHAEIVKPRFDLVISKLDEKIAPWAMGRYIKPKGGYFISFYAWPGTAKRIHGLMKDAGVIMTGPGATYPYGKDPDDSNLRIAPTFASLEELDVAMDVFCTCIKLASVEQLLEA